MKPLNLLLTLAFLLVPVDLAAAHTNANIFATSEDFQDTAKPKSAYGAKTGAYELLRESEDADWAYQDASFTLGELPSEVPLYVGIISHEDGTFSVREMAEAYQVPALAYIENSLTQRGIRLYHCPEASKLSTDQRVKMDAGLRAKGDAIKAQMAQSPVMASRFKEAAEKDPSMAANLRAMGVTFDDQAAEASLPFPASPQEAPYAIVVLMQSLSDDVNTKKPGFLARHLMVFTGALNTNEIYILKNGVPVAAVRDTVAFGGLGDSRATKRIGERLVAVLK